MKLKWKSKKERCGKSNESPAKQWWRTLFPPKLLQLYSLSLFDVVVSFVVAAVAVAVVVVGGDSQKDPLEVPTTKKWRQPWISPSIKSPFSSLYLSSLPLNFSKTHGGYLEVTLRHSNLQNTRDGALLIWKLRPTVDHQGINSFDFRSSGCR